MIHSHTFEVEVDSPWAYLPYGTGGSSDPFAGSIFHSLLGAGVDTLDSPSYKGSPSCREDKGGIPYSQA